MEYERVVIEGEKDEIENCKKKEEERKMQSMIELLERDLDGLSENNLATLNTLFTSI